MWKGSNVERAPKATTCYVRESSPEQEVGVMPLPPVYEEKAGQQAV